MGMPGMNAAEMQAYAGSAPAAPAVKQAAEAKPVRGMTVAELRNGLNPVTGYYDKYDAAAFFADGDISNATKLETLFGRFMAAILAMNPELEKKCIEIVDRNLSGKKG